MKPSSAVQKGMVNRMTGVSNPSELAAKSCIMFSSRKLLYQLKTASPARAYGPVSMACFEAAITCGAFVPGAQSLEYFK